VPAKRYSVEQIMAKLREAEKYQAQGLTIPRSCKRLGISEQTFCRWRSSTASRVAISPPLHELGTSKVNRSLQQLRGYSEQLEEVVRLVESLCARLPA
jgi:hypothetical protein